MIERHVTFEVLSDRAKDFEEIFINEYRSAMSRMAGFVRVELLCEHDSPLLYKMIIRFETLDSAAAWRASSEHQTLSPRLKACYSSSQVQVYQVIA